MKQLTYTVIVAVFLTLLLALAGCSGTTTKTAAPKAEEKPVDPIGGLDALYQMYRPARNWAPDIEVLKMGTIPMQEAQVKYVPGKAVAWQASFVSPSRSKARSWTYSVVEGEGNLHKGPFAGLEEAWSGPRGQNVVFNIQAVKIDTDAAYKTALTKAVDYEKKNPGKTISFLLEQTKKHPVPYWRVVWGESVGASNFSVLIDANTGRYLETMH
jgi:hypothetical protein